MSPAIALRRPRDAALVSVAAVHALTALLWPIPPVIALGMWWNANTVSHNFIHRPFFRSTAINQIFSAVLSVLLGIPQTLWRDRHLAHHAGVAWRWRTTRQLIIEIALVLLLWIALALWRPHFFLAVYLPGYAAGLILCAMQGYWEHASGPPISHYGSLYNALCFNDGFHAEHHASPGVHWSELPSYQNPDVLASRFPALLRWFDLPFLECLERLVLRSKWLRRFVIRTHRRAIEQLLAQSDGVHRITIVGGGLFPRTALIVGQLFPAARLTIIDSAEDNIRLALRLLSGNIEWRNEVFHPGEALDADIAIVPLCLRGNRKRIYEHPPARTTLIHDWIWQRRRGGAVVSIGLLKCINVVRL